MYIRLACDHDKLTYVEHRTAAAYFAAARANPPPWALWTVPDGARIRFCPFCGAAVPAIRLRKRPPKRIRVVTDGGYYCDTCKLRLESCGCASIERLWEPVPKGRKP